MRPPVGDLQLRTRTSGNADEIGILVEEILHLLRHLGREALQVEVFLTPVVVAEAVDPVGLVALHEHRFVGEVLPEIVTGDIVLIFRGPHD